jgi:soluble lytic murein transglycosylase-like protein
MTIRILRLTTLLGIAATLLFGCALTPSTANYTHELRQTPPHLTRALNFVLSWPESPNVDALKGAMPIRDGPLVQSSEFALARAILHTNPRIAQAGALLLAVVTAREARANGLPVEFLGAALLQESAYDPRVMSSAGAIGIAQFEPETAAGEGIDPWDPFASIAGAADLLGSYVRAYTGVYDNPYDVALAAYNAGPGAVAHYGGVPPFAETREYVDLIHERWARISSYEAVASIAKKAAP